MEKLLIVVVVVPAVVALHCGPERLGEIWFFALLAPCILGIWAFALLVGGDTPESKDRGDFGG
jgi:hypothetical protein